MDDAKARYLWITGRMLDLEQQLNQNEQQHHELFQEYSDLAVEMADTFGVIRHHHVA